MSKIYFKPTSLEGQFPTRIDTDNCYLELKEEHFIWRVKFEADEPVDKDDKALGLKNTFNNYNVVGLKKYTTGVDKSITENGKRWAVIIFATGFSYDIKMFFLKEQEAQNMFDAIYKWLLK